MTNQCPRCAMPRVGGHQFCARCGFDFQTAPLAQPPAPTLQPTAAAPPPQQFAAQQPPPPVAPPPLAAPELCVRCRAPLYPGYAQCTNCGHDRRAAWGYPGTPPKSKGHVLPIALAIVVVVVLVAAGILGLAVSQSHGTEAPTGTPTPVTLRWFLGIQGQGTQPAQVAAVQAFVGSYNASNTDGITLTTEVVPQASAYDTLKNEIAAGDAPDIVGPMGVKGWNGLSGVFLDLTSEITKNKVDMTAFASGAVKVLRDGTGAQIGIPYDIYPGFIWYNKDLFTAAGMPNLPSRVGDTYQGQPWDWNELVKVAGQLTIDKNGRKSTDAGFDSKNIVQYGMDFQWLDARRIASLFGAGSVVAADGKTAQIPSFWPDTFSWYYKAIWTSHIVPNGTAESSPLLAQGNTQSSGHVAMNASWEWSLNLIAADAATSKVKNWDIAVMPSWNGSTTAAMDTDTFAIPKASKNHDAAFKAMLSIMADKNLRQVFAGEPANKADQAAFYTGLDVCLSSIYPNNQVTWSVLSEMENYAVVPSHESDMPNATQAWNDIDAFGTKLQNTPGLVVADQLAALKAKLQTDFDAAS
jgi:multiple sugar transport system substrate-binding protein